MLKNYVGTVAVSIGTLLLVVFVLCPTLISRIGVDGDTLTPEEWISGFAASCVFSIVVCMLSLLAWIYLSRHVYAVDLEHGNSHMSYWILHSLPPLAFAFGGFFFQPSLRDGWFAALVVIAIPVLAQFWLCSILFSPYKKSVLGGGLARGLGALTK